jgi:uroporphyrinogen-III synthase
MHLIVTRPPREAQQWVQALRAAGHDATALPLIAIGPAPDAAAVAAAWRELPCYRAVMFVSAQAVQGFFAAQPSGPSAPLPAQAWATGPGTARALRAAGMPAPAVISPPADADRFDSEALWQCVAPTLASGQRVLIVRGADAAADAVGSGRDWLAERLQAAGLQVDFVASYQRLPPALDTAQQQLAQQAAGDGTLWLFSSSEAVRNLRAALPQQSWQAARALATHPRIAEAARQAGFGEVRTTRATLEAVLASIESLR